MERNKSPTSIINLANLGSASAAVKLGQIGKQMKRDRREQKVRGNRDQDKTEGERGVKYIMLWLDT